MSGLTIFQLSLSLVPLFLSANLAKNDLLANPGCEKSASGPHSDLCAPLVNPDSIS
jgi:hypothetical protein